MKLTEEIDQTIDALTEDLAKAIVVRELAHRIGTPVSQHEIRTLENEARFHLEKLRRRNDVFAQLPELHVFMDGATLILKWPHQLADVAKRVVDKLRAITDIPVDGPGSHRADLAELRAQTARADKAEADNERLRSYAADAIDRAEARAAAGEQLAREVCKIVDSDGSKWRMRITDAVIEHDKVAPPKVPTKLDDIKTAADVLMFNAQRIADHNAVNKGLRCAGCNMPDEDGTLWVTGQRLLCGSCLRKRGDTAEHNLSVWIKSVYDAAKAAGEEKSAGTIVDLVKRLVCERDAERHRADKAEKERDEALADCTAAEKETHVQAKRLRAQDRRIAELEAALRGTCEYAELIGSQTDDVHIAVMEVARAALAPASPATAKKCFHLNVPTFKCDDCGWSPVVQASSKSDQNLDDASPATADEGAKAYQDIIDYIDEAPLEWTSQMIVRGVLTRCERLKDDRGARPINDASGNLDSRTDDDK